ncbi:hypothetical protein [Rhodospirillum rubrum]|uniref:Uncharacterized protein n=1 Tax=Rhodospirillum rubrum (strain ATCC 11170 / ATH 1.1.1 / DSM 467 / LMG 4362 / NCIMB 8255 / S1) TaxID=269796 RepID=Q2RTI7_RHORT|nr:hypothetical protein [Rhodospirillum rubrum]ABC22558.1 hypothetical protein Rru_A1758 [Rhodospirillum rubrum ATCC 11170]AEO48276.1 hypothetical protein F11_09050 [Rhodospirillum rubrum F11]MBK1663558.1 hypothetical protein [Rhodospirillum rubrum]MBK1675641.1 hypothetical protein [Rhodospirillum rubrum]MBK5954147.1 hypothetical protein [Rhodospirillum rubrum]
MPFIRCTLGQHMAAAFSVVALSIVFAGAIDVGTTALGLLAGVQSPQIEDVGGIGAPASAEWGRTVLALSGMH